jgi:hypothetical protein
VNSKRGRAFEVKHSFTAEPVFLPEGATLMQFMAMRKVSTRGISNANMAMPMAAMSYNLKNYLKFAEKQVEFISKSAEKRLLDFLVQIGVKLKLNAEQKF